MAPLFMSSCSDDVTQSPVDEPEELKGPGYFSINLVADPTPPTRATQEEMIYAWEHRVESVWVLFYNSDNELEEKFEFAVTNYNNGELIDFEDTDPSEPAIGKEGNDPKMQFVTVPKSIARKTYKMIVLVNPEEVMSKYGLNINKTDAQGKLLSALDEKILTISTLSDMDVFGGRRGTATKPFFMSNANGLITVTPSMLQSTEEDALKKPVNVYVDRILSKVVLVEKDTRVTLPANTHLEGFKWHLNVVNTKTFVIREFAEYSNGTMEAEDNSTVAMRPNMYARDPNFDSHPVADFIKVATGSENWATWIESGKDWEDAALPVYQYGLENTMTRDDQNATTSGNYMTYALVHANLIYDNLLTDPLNPSDPGKNYYSYKNTANEWKVFTHEQARFWMERGFPTEMSGLQPLIQANIDDLYYDPTADAFDFKKTTPPTLTRCVTYHEITYHPQGLNIYKIPIRHFGAPPVSAQPKSYGYYGVVRNNIYKVTINSILGPGNEYIDPENGFLSAEISITPWYRRDFQIIDVNKQQN